MRAGGVFFDLYGTLVTLDDVSAAWADWLTALHAALLEFGLQMNRDEFALCCDGFFGRPEPAAGDEGYTAYERRMRVHTAELGLVLDRKSLKRVCSAALDAWHAHVRIDPEARQVLAELKPHTTLALISNFDQAPHVHAFLSEEGLAGFFDAVLVSDEVGLKKPDPRIFQLALERTGLTPERVLHVGDMRDDVVGARAAGITPVLIRREWAEPIIPDFLIRSNPSDYFSNEAPSDEVRVIGALSALIDLVQAG
ncbi:MAG: HAD family hydrolase [Armatimonadota bacterium]